MKVNKTDHDAYPLLDAMRQRCSKSNHSEYKNYGARGIKVCKEWLNNTQSFIDWCDSSGYKKGLQIDRINNDGDYEPTNCRWVTPSVNSQNTRIRKGFTSKYRGVSWSKSANKWVATIMHQRKQFYLGSFEDEKEAAITFNRWVIDNKTHHTLNKI